MLVQVILFIQAKKLHDTQQGKAAAAAPRTSRSGRPKQRPKQTDQPDSRLQPVQVCWRCFGRRPLLELRLVALTV